MPGDVGGRINAVATSSGGTALAGPVIRARVDAELAKDPKPTEEQIVTTVGARNNPNETGYGGNIWATYKQVGLSPTLYALMSLLIVLTLILVAAFLVAGRRAE